MAKIKRHFGKHGLTYFGSCLFLAHFVLPLGNQAYINTQWKDLGNGFGVLERRDDRIFNLGNGRFGKDEGGDNTLDQTFIVSPISAYMGGPGYSYFTVPTTEEDVERFSKAVSLYESEA